ncbi:serine/arginine repetitive matrix protein 1 [Actinomyces viscosus]|uniref:variant leucine-rich repeat-containing protein n=1 Tax=Actinomyces viscosus TaxID=1656 RepID=UPI0028E1E4EE|nr:serine/arginine repetitive matrix protein 1 [Actinomyces viscosus]
MPAHTPDDERRASDPSTEPEVLEYLARAFPELRPAVAANPAVPAVLREQVLQMGSGDLPQVSPASPASAATASGSGRLRTAETAAMPSASTADYSISPYTAVPAGTMPTTDPPTAVLGTSPTVPPTAMHPSPASAPSRPVPGRAPAPPTAPAPAPPASPPAPSPESRPRSHAGLITALVITLVLVVAAAGTFAGMLLANRSRQSETKADGAPSVSAAPARTEGTSAEQAPQPSAGLANETTAEAEATPPPSGPTIPTQSKTYSYQYVDTPSKNISCVLYDEGVGCSILDRSYASSGMQDCAEREFSIVALAGRTEVRCGEEYLGQPGDTFHTLQYGETTVFSDYACTSQSKGMTCWNTITGRGFTISRESHVSF